MILLKKPVLILLPCTLFIVVFFVFMFIKNFQNISIPNLPLTSQQDVKHSTNVIHSNQWYSSIYNTFPTHPIYAFPMAFKLSPDGLEFSYPQIKKDKNTIFASFVNDFTVGTNNKFNKPQITNIGDFSVGVEMDSNAGEKLNFTLAHGIPYTTISSNSELQAKFSSDLTVVENGNVSENSLIIKTKNNYYLFHGQNAISKNGTSLNFGESKKLFVGLLPNLEAAKAFDDLGESEIVSTSVTYEMNENNLLTTYNVNSDNSLIALFPHQFDNLTEKKEVLGSYDTLRGKLNLIQATSFTTSVPMIVPPLTFTPLKKSYQEINSQLIKDIDNYIKGGEPASRNYFFGTWLGKGITLMQLAETLGEEDKKNELVNYITPVFEKSLGEFYYDEKQKSMIAKKPEFGNEKLNDHHFHYGYFIRAAAVLGKENPELLERIKEKIDLLVKDIANADKASSEFPYSRNFDSYESHSWADGYAGFNDGNNQESSSEAVTSWYSVYVWSEIIQDDNLKNHALYLYNSEILGTLYYWFNKANAYSASYEHEIASIVWGGKVDYATWFSAETNMKYGIQILPITPGSDYLGTLSDFTPYENDFIRSGGDIKKEWGDLFVIWQSFYNPQKALVNMKSVTKPEGNTAKSVMMYTVYRNAGM